LPNAVLFLGSAESDFIVCTMCALGDQGKSRNSQRVQPKLSALQCRRWTDVELPFVQIRSSAAEWRSAFGDEGGDSLLRIAVRLAATMESFSEA
jgi:hypothetical protein